MATLVYLDYIIVNLDTSVYKPQYNNRTWVHYVYHVPLVYTWIYVDMMKPMYPTLELKLYNYDILIPLLQQFYHRILDKKN